MNIIRRRGWEISDRLATSGLQPPQPAGGRECRIGALSGLCAAPDRRRQAAGSERRSLSCQTQREIRARPADHRRKGQRQLQ